MLYICKTKGEEIITIKKIKIMRTVSSLKEAIEHGKRVLSKNGFDFSFIGSSDSNGFSAYFRVGELKIRFSDHSIKNISRMRNEVCFSFSANEFQLTQSLLKLKFELGCNSVEYGQIDYITSSGKVLKAFGYKMK